jgi:hypothetical protein
LEKRAEQVCLEVGGFGRVRDWVGMRNGQTMKEESEIRIQTVNM